MLSEAQVLQWGTSLMSAISIKLTSSIDDVVWLAPFLTSNVGPSVRNLNSVIYISVCLVQTFVAMFIATSSQALLDWIRGGHGGWSSDKILTVLAGAFLALYSIKLAWEHMHEEDDEEEDASQTATAEQDVETAGKYQTVSQKEPENGDSVTGSHTNGRVNGGSSITPSELARPLSSGGTGEGEPFRRVNSERGLGLNAQRNLCVIAFLGSMDDLTVFVPMLTGKTFDSVQLTLGAFIAALTIVCICVFIGLCKPVADCLARIPLAFIVVFFALFLLIKGFFFTE